MKIIGTLISLILLFTSCENGLKEKAEKEIIAKMNNPKSYEFVELYLIDSISNHKYYKEILFKHKTKSYGLGVLSLLSELGVADIIFYIHRETIGYIMIF